MNNERLVRYAQFITLAHQLTRLHQARLLCSLLRRSRIYTQTSIASPGRPLPTKAPDKIVLPANTDTWPWLRRAIWPNLPEERHWRGLLDEETAPVLETLDSRVIG